MDKPSCSIEGCERPVRTRGWCDTHYNYFLRRKEFTPRPKLTPLERFLAMVDKNGPVGHLGTPCWLWTGGTAGKGYGVFWWNSRLGYAHRFSYEQTNGSIDDGLQVDHRCFVICCVNPEHLRAATCKQNLENRSGPMPGNTSGVRGVSWSKHHNKWIAQVKHHGKRVYSAQFDTIEEAEAAVIAKRNELFTHNDLDRKSA